MEDIVPALNIHCIFLRNLRFLSVAGIKHGICVTTNLEELNLYVDDCDRYNLQSRKKEYHWTIFVLISPLIRYSGTEFDSYNSHFPYIASIFCVCLNHQEKPDMLSA